MNNFFNKRAYCGQSGIISPLILIGVVSVLVLFVVLSTLPIKDRLLGGLFPKSDSQAAGNINLSLVPNAVSVSKDQTFLVDVVMDAGTAQPTAAQLNIKFDPTVLQALSFKNGFFFNTDTFQGSPSLIINNTTGVAAGLLTVGPEPLGCTILVLNGLMPADQCVFNYKSGNAPIATLEFKALKATTPTSALQFDVTNDRTQIAALDLTGNQVGTVTDSVVTVSDTPVVTKTAEFSLTTPASINVGQQFNVSLRVKSTEEANLFASRLNFNPALLEVVSISTANSFITQWVNDNTFDNATGQISLIGGVPAPGYKNTAPATMATIVFRAKSPGAALIGFGATSAIYRNSDNKDILIIPVPGSTINVTGVAPSTSPSIAPSPSPVVSPSPVSSPAASASVAPSAAPSASPAASASVAPSPSGSPVPLACSITSANWVTSANPANQGQIVGLNVVGSGNCAGQNVSFTVLEDDGLLGTDAVRNTPPATKFNSSNTATSNWMAEYQDDPSLIENNVPEYFFRAQLTTGTSVKSADPVLKVNKLGTGVFLTGDVNKDGVVDLVDLSILLSNWNKTQDFLDELDLNSDGTVNAIDWSTMIQILRVTGVIQ